MFIKPMHSFILITLILAGCASNKDTLQLPNILEENARRQAQLQEQEEKAKQELDAIREQIRLMQEAEVEITLSEIYEKSKFNPRELAFLEWPDSFYPLTGRRWDSEKMEMAVNETFPEAFMGWRARAMNVVVLVSKNVLDKEKMAGMPEAEFNQELQRVSEQIRAYYLDNKKAEALVHIRKYRAMTVMEIISKYLEKEEWQTSYRYIFFYNQDYRLNILIHGRDKYMRDVAGQIEETMGLFQRRIADYFFAEPV